MILSLPRPILFVLLLVSLASASHAAIRSETVEYRHGDTVLEGVVTYDDARSGPRPAVLVIHQWKGLSDYEKKRSRMLAELGYVAFAADIYGRGVRPPTPEEAGREAGKYKADRGLLQARAKSALDQVRRLPQVDGRRVAAIGYCFGGTAALELARSGADVSGVVSFHGGLANPTPENARQIRARVLALHGADDPFVPAAEVAGFEDEMRKARVDWQLVSYGGAVHSFTDWSADGSFNPGAKYQEAADRRSWEAMKTFFAEIFR